MKPNNNRTGEAMWIIGVLLFIGVVSVGTYEDIKCSKLKRTDTTAHYERCVKPLLAEHERVIYTKKQQQGTDT